jgi:hypothetical protein
MDKGRVGSISPDLQRLRHVRLPFNSDGFRLRGAVRFVAKTGYH